MDEPQAPRTPLPTLMARAGIVEYRLHLSPSDLPCVVAGERCGEGITVTVAPAAVMYSALTITGTAEQVERVALELLEGVRRASLGVPLPSALAIGAAAEIAALRQEAVR